MRKYFAVTLIALILCVAVVYSLRTNTATAIAPMSVLAGSGSAAPQNHVEPRRKQENPNPPTQTPPGQLAKLQNPVSLSTVRVTKGGDGTEIQINGSGPMRADAMKLENPDRLVIDLPNATWAKAPKQIAVRASDVKDVRLALYQVNPPVTRVVVDLAAARDYELVPSGNSIRVKLHVPGTAASAVQATTSNNAGREAVGCLGRIEPLDGVLQITGGYLDGRPQRVRELKVKEGDQVRAGQLLAVLDGKDQLQAALQLAEARVTLARSRLTQVKAGARASDIAAQQAQVSELKAALENARTEYKRYEGLRQKTDISSAELDARRLAVTTTEQKLQQAEERLKSISEVRATDVDVAQSELRVASAEQSHARAELQTAMVYSPANGRVLKISAYPGEEPGPEGLLDLGKTDVMYVVAEVYETDIARVHPGQHAVIRSELFPGQLSGVVETVGNVLSKNSVLPIDPVSFADARVFKVRIRLDKGNEVAGLINIRVNVVFQP